MPAPAWVNVPVGASPCAALTALAMFALAYGNTGMARNSDVVVGIVVAAVAVYRTFVASPGAHQKVTA